MLFWKWDSFFQTDKLCLWDWKRSVAWKKKFKLQSFEISDGMKEWIWICMNEYDPNLQLLKFLKSYFVVYLNHQYELINVTQTKYLIISALDTFICSRKGEKNTHNTHMQSKHLYWCKSCDPIAQSSWRAGLSKLRHTGRRSPQQGTTNSRMKSDINFGTDNLRHTD